MGGCAICARSFWVEDLYELDLFTPPAQDEEMRAHEGAAPGEREEDGADEEEEAPAKAGKKCRFTVHPRCAEKVHKLLDVKRYARRWPKIPKHELFASSVQHPHVPEWRWLLHTRRMPPMEPGAGACYPTIPACYECVYPLCADIPKRIEMLRYALANDNWIDRMPFAITPCGEPLREMTKKTLCRGRMCVHKIIAEPERRAPPDTKHRGLRGNNVAFSPAKVELLRSAELPAAREEAAEFMSKL